MLALPVVVLLVIRSLAGTEMSSSFMNPSSVGAVNAKIDRLTVELLEQQLKLTQMFADTKIVSVFLPSITKSTTAPSVDNVTSSIAEFHSNSFDM